ncbi:phage major capsid protein [Pelagibacterium lentulum]|uniref:Phage capsid protein n=1 Tax=Pelagibacterium lentulum TaxID=2029865 RepID=A0A916VX20_9HYPH|nr:phage major capsid protein [Pelagibacterium lentulum]GGA47289.1 phage capsid protein [Pelagibacterium lentulum]
MTTANQLTAIAEAVETIKGEYNSRLRELEMRAAREPDNDNRVPVSKSLGSQVAASQDIKDLTSSFRGKAVVRLTGERADITSAPATVGNNTSGTTSLVQSDRRPGIVTPPERKFTVRDLLRQTTTTSSLIEWPEETDFTNEAAPVEENPDDPKPQSDLEFEMRSAPVRTLAHIFKGSRQILDDAPALISYIDRRGTYGLKLVEENQLLNGNGVGQNVLGIVPQASAYDTSRTGTGDDELSILNHAIAQSEESDYDPDGIVLSVRDWRRLLDVRGTDGHFLSNGAFGTTARRVWNLPVVPSRALAPGQFLVGSFEMAAEIFDRQEVEFMLSTENEDDFVRNRWTGRIEERLALAVYHPRSFIIGDFEPAAS